MESWTDSKSAAEEYADAKGKHWSIVLEMPSPDGVLFKDASSLVHRFSDEISKESVPPVETESEWMLRTGERFEVAKINRDPETRTITVLLQARGTR
jgi:hypothetical protein